jgi:hypothetical protein
MIAGVAPADPAAGTRRIFVDSGTGELSVRTSAGTTVSLEAQGSGTFGETSLAGLVNNQTLWDGANTPRTLTFAVTGTDPVMSFSDTLINITTGALQVGGNAVLNTSNVANESTAGIIEIATAAEINTATDTGRAIAPDQFNGSVFGEIVTEIEVFEATVDNATGNGKVYFVVPSKFDGMSLIDVQGHVIATGTTGTLTVALTRCDAVATGDQCSGTTAQMLSTNLTIDSGENKSATAAAAPVIDTANDDVSTDQVIRVDISAVHTTPAKGLVLKFSFRKP